jgi:hypothetical protein
MTDGAMWGPDFDPASVNRIPWGSANIAMPTCTDGTVEFVPNAAMVIEGYTTFGYPVNRDLTDFKVQCPSFVNNPN